MAIYSTNWDPDHSWAQRKNARLDQNARLWPLRAPVNADPTFRSSHEYSNVIILLIQAAKS